MQPDVSIIMPIYNVEKYLQQSIYSVIKQTIRNIEIICVNDGSTDSSLSILEYFAEKDKRIRLVTTANMGYGHAMNIGLEIAKGKYIGIVEPDDYVAYEMFEYLFDVAEIQQVDIVKSDFFRFTDQEGENMKFYQPAVTDAKYYGRLINPGEEKECFRFIMNIWCGIYKREFIEENQIRFNETAGAAFQDNGFWFKTMCYAKSIYYLNKTFYMNRRDNPNSSVNRKDNIYACNAEYEYIREFLKENKEIRNKFLDAYMVKKYETYKFNLNRMDSTKIFEYIRYISSEWKRDLEAKELRKGAFLQEEWQEIEKIINLPEQYLEERINQNQLDNDIGDKSLSTIMDLKNENAAIRYEIGEIRKSISYKIALFITWLPRKIKERISNNESQCNE